MPISVVLVAIVLGVMVSPASAGGSHLTPVKDRYDPGDEATLVGYIWPGQSSGVEDGPFYAYLVPADEDGTLSPPSGTELGPLTLEKTEGRGYLSLRVSITFPIPADLAPGLYGVTYCNVPCDKGIGDLIGGSVSVGVGPLGPYYREWALDEPEIANLADDAFISGPGFLFTAAKIRAGDLPPSSSEFYAFGGTRRPVPAALPTTQAPPGKSQRTATAPRTSSDDASWVVPSALVFAGLVLLGTRLMLRSRLRRARVILEGTPSTTS